MAVKCHRTLRPRRVCPTLLRGLPRRLVPPPPQNITAQPQSQAWLLLGSSAAAQFGPALGFYLSKGLFTKHDSLAAAAAHIGAPAEVLAAEVESYNAAAAAGGDQFGKSVFPAAIEPGEPVHVALITPVVHYTMVGGRSPRLPTIYHHHQSFIHC